MRNRYPGAQPFSTAQEGIFFGRKQEAGELYRFVQAEQLVVLYAKSGLGKSSLLNAGLIPLVREEGGINALTVRFGAYVPDGGNSPLDIAAQKIKEGANAVDSNLDKIKPAGENSLWYHLKTRQLVGGESSHLLIIDQFEELFTYPDTLVKAFARELSEVFFANIPDRFRKKLEAGLGQSKDFLSGEELQRLHEPFMPRVVMAIRSDRMSLMNKLKPFLPNVLENCYELRSLTIEEAESAILSPAYLPQETGLFAAPIFDYQDDAVASLIDFLSKGRTQEIESFQLQILCEYVERQIVQQEGKIVIEAADIAHPEGILENYYLGKIKGLPDVHQLPARRLIEEGLVFEEEERRLTLYEGQIARTYGISPELLRLLLDTHLIRSEPSLRGGYTYELSHDTLVAPVLRAKEQRLAEEIRIREAEERQRKAAELEEVRQKAEQERLLREKAERGERRSRRLARLAIIISVFAIALAVFAGWNYIQAERSNQLAESKTEEANQNFQKAKQEEAKAQKTLQDLAIAKKATDQNFQKAKQEEAKAQKTLQDLAIAKKATEQQRQEAQHNFELAKQKTIEAEGALARATRSNEQVATAFIRDMDMDILNLDYEKALERAKAAASLGAKKQDIAIRLLEIAFWFNESGRSDRAYDIFNHAVKLAGVQLNPAGKDLLSLRAAMKKLDQGQYELLWKRYYPYMVFIKGGEFLMGCDVQERRAAFGENSQCPIDELLHPVTVDDYMMAETETTIWQYALFLATQDKYVHADRPNWLPTGNHPIVNVDWYDAIAYANWLNTRIEGLEGEVVYHGNIKTADVKANWSKRGFRLPTEAEWEYAAKTSRPTIFSGTSSLDSVRYFANYNDGGGTSDGYAYTSPVKSKRPNSNGLYDMSGNAKEWCWDWYSKDYYPGSPSRNPRGSGSTGYRVLRGGAWSNAVLDCTVSSRFEGHPVERMNSNGFRLAKNP